MNTDRIKVIMRDYPCDVHGYVVEKMDDDGDLFYTICINAKMNIETQWETILHELRHICSGDFAQAEQVPVGDIESATNMNKLAI